MTLRTDRPLGSLPVLLGGLVVVELVLLRTTTRTLVHIPGLGRYDTLIRGLAETGRYAYYLATLLLVSTLALLSAHSLQSSRPRILIAGVATLLFLGVAGAGRVGAVSPEVVGWCSTVIVMVLAITGWRGLPTLPIGLFVTASATAGLAVLGQGTGGGLTGTQVDVLFIVAEVSLVLAALTTPLLLKIAPTRAAVAGGAGAVAVAIALMAGGSSTVSILGMWNLGIPGWLPGISHALALGSLVLTLWSAMAERQRLTAIGLVLLAAGGVGVISTYQTGLVIAGILLISHPVAFAALPDDESRLAEASGKIELPLPVPA